MRTYSFELKEQLVGKLLTDGSPSVAEFSAQSGVIQSTLWRWLQRYRVHGSLVPRA